MKDLKKTILIGLALTTLCVSGIQAQTDAAADLPPNAKPGECYARVLIPGTYATETERILSKEAADRIEVVPAKFEWVEETVLVKEAATKLEVVPAKYDWAEEKIMVKSASSRLEQVPAKYEWVEEKVLVKPAQTVWKKGTGPIQKVDNGTGEIMCLVEEPAVYEMVRKRVLVAPAKTVKVDIPAEYKTVRKRVLVKPPSTRETQIPAEYETLKVKKLVTPPQEHRVEIPAEYKTVTKRSVVSESRLVWQPVLCQTNMNPGVVTKIQRALASAGHKPGPIDGVIGTQTMTAVRSFQRSKGLATGGLTMETLNALNVRAR